MRSIVRLIFYIPFLILMHVQLLYVNFFLLIASFLQWVYDIKFPKILNWLYYVIYYFQINLILHRWRDFFEKYYEDAFYVFYNKTWWYYCYFNLEGKYLSFLNSTSTKDVLYLFDLKKENKKDETIQSLKFKELKFYFKKFKKIFRYLLLIKYPKKKKKKLLLFFLLHQYITNTLTSFFKNWYILRTSYNISDFKPYKLYFSLIFLSYKIIKNSWEYAYISFKTEDLLLNLKKMKITYYNNTFIKFFKKTKKYKYDSSLLEIMNSFKKAPIAHLKQLYTHFFKIKKLLFNLIHYNFNTYFKLISSYKMNIYPNDITKNINFSFINYYYIYYIRKVKLFSKGRYSRNRQYYRTGVYWCLWLNIMLMLGFYFFFYRFTYKLTYVWWLFYLFISLFVVVRFISTSSFFFLFSEIKLNIIWFTNFLIFILLPFAKFFYVLKYFYNFFLNYK